MAYEGRTYLGIQGAGDDEDEWQPARLLVEKPEPGPTERQSVTVLRKLKAKYEDELGGYGWGYNGSGTNRAAAVIPAELEKTVQQFFAGKQPSRTGAAGEGR